jgi:hypothetical protein
MIWPSVPAPSLGWSATTAFAAPALLTAETVRAKVGDRRTLEEAGVRCAKCHSRKFTVTRFNTRSAAHAFMRNL